MTNTPEQPYAASGGVEYPSLESQPAPVDPYTPVDYPTGYPSAGPGLPPPVYPPPYGNTPVYPGYPGYPGGYPGTHPYDPYRPMKPPGTNGKAIAALVTSVLGLLFCGLPSIAGVILGIIAMRETKRTGQDGYGLAVAGVIVGGLVVALIVVYIVVVAAIAASGWSAV